MPTRIQLANDTEDNWAQESIPLAQGELGWATDSLTLKVGDGNTLWVDLPGISIGGVPSVRIDDSKASSTATWSSQKIADAILKAQNADQKYTDDSLQGVSSSYRVVDQNADGTWPNRPSVPNVLARTYYGSTTLPTWLTPADEVEYRSA